MELGAYGVSLCAALNAWTWGITDGSLLKFKKYAGLLQKYNASNLEIRIIKAIYRCRTFLTNGMIKAMGMKSGESWPAAIQRWLMETF